MINFVTTVAVIVVICLVVIFLTGYVKASPDTALIISGLRKKPKVLIGKAGIKIPFLERKDALNLQLIPIDVKTSSAVPTADYININVDATVNVKISDNEERLKLAAQNFLNKKPEYIGHVAREVLEGNVREIVGKMALEEMVSDRQKFAMLVKENAEPDLAAMGLDIISFNVQNFVDGNGVIENLGVDNIVKIQKNAAISRAESEKEIAKAQAQAKREANEAEVNAESEIAKKKNELDIQKAELKREADVKRAEADAAYKIQEEEQRKTVEVTTANANIAKQEKEILLKQREAEVMEQALDAQVKKKAEAEKFAKQQFADAQLYERQREAEAKKFETEKESEAMRAQADAKKYTMEQEAEGIRTRGVAEAEAIRAKAVAEAEGIEKKAEAMAKMGEAAVLEMYFKALPEVVKNAAEPLSNVDKITMYGEGNSAKLMKDVMGTVVQITDGLKESTGVDLQAVLSGFLAGKVATTKQNHDPAATSSQDSYK
ncbi:MAG: SPFH domain-containing protein [Eubacterium sp.]|nr:SPFH domain-containing protein [Eubacterium sp.]MCM1214461.1 SPFH domain-containing protein [Lachnospiraceae bacterium]MCM1304245.1 SPFH domain-containing protein [Butyrivibrio sp.]MCM1345006.1 SPFH domain-containing protein [Muribaculaceae bacterium]MCM1238751.1 SPFH domain-containing protein [Lachnospiraceae bacterium]